jgi:integrase
MASKRSDGRWAASLKEGKKRLWFYSWTSEADAEAQKLAYKEGSSKAAKPIEGTLGHFVDAVWWPRIRARCKLPTQKRYADLWRLHVGAKWESYRLENIKLEDAQVWLNSLSEKPKSLSPKSVLLIREILVNILNLAEKTGRLPRNEVRWTVTPSAPKKKVRRDLTLDRMKALVKAAEGTDMEGPVFAAAFLGLRRGEVCGLKVTDLDVRSNLVHLRRTRSKNYEGPLKKRNEGEERILPVTASIMKRLRAYALPGSIYLFSWNGRPVNPDRLTHNMEELCKKAEVPVMTFHDLRAAAASNLRALGVDPWRIMQILGHSQIDTTTIYQDEREEDMRTALGALSEGMQ